MPKLKRLQLISSEEAEPCSVQITKPCSDCPWARAALPGWLGDMSADEWIQAAHAEDKIDCHALLGPECAGAAIYRANVAKLPRFGQLKLPADRMTVFANPAEFKQHHSKRPKK